MTKTYYGFHWNHNVYQGSEPVPSMGQVFYVVDDYGSLVMVNRSRLSHSLS